MSGTNPFRRKNTGDQSFNSPAGSVNNAFPDRPEAWVPPIDTDIPRVSKSKTGKTVRIISPHSASSDVENGTQRFFSPPARAIVSPPPAGLLSPDSSEGETSEDPFGAESDAGGSSAQDEGTLRNTLNNSGDLKPNTNSRKGIPANPFAKTLASLNTEILPNVQPRSNENRSSESDSRAARPLYDVDDFKKLLLTGAKSNPAAPAPAAPPVSFQSLPSTGDSNSNTDASSISRQSIFEPVSSPLQESSRTSYEGSPTDEERQQLVGNPPIGTAKPKPPAPRHRHGKLVKANGPQIVSFEDPTLSFGTTTTTTSSDVPTPMSPKSPGGVDKPLPSLPFPSDARHTSESTVADIDTIKRRSYSGSSDRQASPAPQKRNAPPPPLSRRHSLRPRPLAASERSTPISEEGPTVSAPRRSSSPSSITTKVPPPPPPRRSGLIRGNSSSSVSTSASIGPMLSQSSTDQADLSSTKPRAPAPPTSSPTLSAIKRQSTLPGSPSTAPAPPPRRRGSSASQNYTPSRLSGNYSAAAGRMRSDSGASSISQLQMTSPSPSSTDPKDVMADLTALQREVDELRGKFKD